VVVFIVSNVISLPTTKKLLSKIPVVIKLQHLREAYDCLNSQLTASHFALFLVFRIFNDAVTSNVISIHQCGFVYLYTVALASLLIKNQPFELN